ncbi:hypothetical protein OUZ56_023353 [Daphnia magna]|uniref:Uncharacterized protein n=1 Tax=Daphnia magna TaxID=35525 RepID=A0ABR0AZ09_9CRUS|nr:hypothetical protein OUZ56_023353 [Daphnia magna]
MFEFEMGDLNAGKLVERTPLKTKQHTVWHFESPFLHFYFPLSAILAVLRYVLKQASVYAEPANSVVSRNNSSAKREERKGSLAELERD